MPYQSMSRLFASRHQPKQLSCLWRFSGPIGHRCHSRAQPFGHSWRRSERPLSPGDNDVSQITSRQLSLFFPR